MACRATAGDQQRGCAHRNGFRCHRRGQREVGQRHIARRQQAGVHRAEIDHAAVVRAGGAVRHLHVAAVLPPEQPAVVEGVEQQLALEAQQIQRTWPIIGQERTRGREVLAQHDLLRLDCTVRIAAVTVRQPLERDMKIRQLLVH